MEASQWVRCGASNGSLGWWGESFVCGSHAAIATSIPHHFLNKCVQTLPNLHTIKAFEMVLWPLFFLLKASSFPHVLHLDDDEMGGQLLFKRWRDGLLGMAAVRFVVFH